MKILILYFSGTGHTKRVAVKWREELLKLEHEVSLHSIEDIKPNDLNLDNFDLLGIGFPIHAFNTPQIVMDYFKDIRSTKSLEAFNFMVSGEYLRLNHSAGNRLKRLLKKKNIKITNEYHYLMPYNIIFRHTEDIAYKMDSYMRQMVAIDAANLLNERHQLKKCHLMGWATFMLRIEHPFTHTNGKHFKIDSTKCIKCMKCINTCPTANIKYQDGKFGFANKCILCMRCSFNCPTDAFKIGMLNNWRVNKPYQFKANQIEEVDKHPNFCKKSYQRYYDECNQIINNKDKKRC